MERWVGKVAIVTGASSGIGAAIAEKLTYEGCKVVGVARRRDRLESLANSLTGKKGTFHSFQGDMSKEEDIRKVFAWAKENVGLVHILINNAGIFRPFNNLNFNYQDAQDTMNLNVLGLTVAAREALQVFKENNINGHIININSIVGHSVMDYPGLGMYTASKYAVTALTQALSLEVKRSKLGIKVTSLSPGLVETEIISEASKERIQSNQMPALQAVDIANAAVYVLSTPTYCQIDELTITPIQVQ